nr:hypothetical protein Iba_chr05aCG9480 [Ipomoea batatas]GMC93959.1 hypothetical protein Iba_chr05bCG7410 [Ipomoea batatas]GMD83610.1 hypothetical protein Iba_chr14aCG6770 [Ipomoea batatas]
MGLNIPNPCYMLNGNLMEALQNVLAFTGYANRQDVLNTSPQQGPELGNHIQLLKLSPRIEIVGLRGQEIGAITPAANERKLLRGSTDVEQNYAHELQPRRRTASNRIGFGKSCDELTIASAVLKPHAGRTELIGDCFGDQINDDE